MAARVPALALVFSVLAAGPSAAGPCEDELARQSAEAGIPAPLAQALASSLAVGPRGRMHPYAVSAGGRATAEASAEAAARAASRLLRSGHSEVRVGCLGASLVSGMDEAGILRMIDPRGNVASALVGIGGSGDGIGEALQAIAEGAPPPPPAVAYPPEVPEEPVHGPAVAHRAAAPLPPRKGSIGGGWSLFTNSAAKPLTNP